MQKLQQDWLSIPARSLIALLATLTPPQDEVIAEIYRKLLKWDCVLDPRSAEASLYVFWERRLKEAVWRLVSPAEVRKIVSWKSYSTERMIQALESPDGRFGADPIAGRDALLLAELANGLGDMLKLGAGAIGFDHPEWFYGNLKHVKLEHPLSAAVKDSLRARLDLGPLPRGGAAHTVNSTSDGDNQTAGASFRIIADAGDWDRSLGTNSPGQSGDPASLHYRDLFGPWNQGGYFPVFYTRAKIDSIAESADELVP